MAALIVSTKILVSYNNERQGTNVINMAWWIYRWFLLLQFIYNYAFANKIFVSYFSWDKFFPLSVKYLRKFDNTGPRLIVTESQDNIRFVTSTQKLDLISDTPNVINIWRFYAILQLTRRDKQLVLDCFKC